MKLKLNKIMKIIVIVVVMQLIKLQIKIILKIKKKQNIFMKLLIRQKNKLLITELIFNLINFFLE